MAAAALVGSVVGSVHNHRHGHNNLSEKRGNASDVCVPSCSTVYYTITGEAGRMWPPLSPRPL